LFLGVKPKLLTSNEQTLKLFRRTSITGADRGAHNADPFQVTD
jgi:hypothetical protein